MGGGVGGGGGFGVLTNKEKYPKEAGRGGG